MTNKYTTDIKVSEGEMYYLLAGLRERVRQLSKHKPIHHKDHRHVFSELKDAKSILERFEAISALMARLKRLEEQKRQAAQVMSIGVATNPKAYMTTDLLIERN